MHGLKDSPLLYFGLYLYCTCIRICASKVKCFHQTAGRQPTIPFVFFSTPFVGRDGNLKAAHRFKCDFEGVPSEEKEKYGYGDVLIYKRYSS